MDAISHRPAGLRDIAFVVTIISLSSAPIGAALADGNATASDYSGTLNRPLQVTDDTGAAHCIPGATALIVWEDATDSASLDIMLRHGDDKVVDCTDSSGKTFLNGSMIYKAPVKITRVSFTGDRASVGVFMVPFKYYKWGDRSFSGSASVGGYLGWERHYSYIDADLTLAVFGGATTIPVQEPSATSTKTQNVSGFSYGLSFTGAIGTGSQSQFGIAIGRDTVSESANWVNNRHGWLAFQFGYKFH